MKPEQPPDGIDIKGSVNAIDMIARLGATVLRPIILARQGKRAYGGEALFVFCALPVVATYARSGAILLYWKVWIGFYAWRRLTPNRRCHTNFWGDHWLARLLTLGLFGKSALLVIEPLMVLGIAYGVSGYSMALGKLLAFSAGCLAIQYGLMRELMKREQEAIDDARYLAGRYR